MLLGKWEILLVHLSEFRESSEIYPTKRSLRVVVVYYCITKSGYLVA